MKKILLTLGIFLSSLSVAQAQTSGPPSVLRVNLDASGNLLAIGKTLTGATTGCLFANCRLTVDASGNLQVVVTGGTGTFSTITFTNGTTLSDTSGSGKLLLTGTNPTIQFGGTTSSFPQIDANGSALEFKKADNSSFTAATMSVASVTALQGTTQGHLFFSETAPSNITSCGGGTAPSFAWNNGTAAFEIITGSSTPVATCTWTMPAAANKWVCNGTDITTQSTSIFYLKQTASATNSVTMTNFNTAGAATAVNASDHLLIACSGG